MTGGLVDYIFEAAKVVRESGVTFDQALEIVQAAHAPEPESNVIYGVDFMKTKEAGGTEMELS
jgi:hypothetical protein